MVEERQMSVDMNAYEEAKKQAQVGLSYYILNLATAEVRTMPFVLYV